MVTFPVTAHPSFLVKESQNERAIEAAIAAT
jgi:hypothetical protein